MQTLDPGSVEGCTIRVQQDAPGDAVKSRTLHWYRAGSGRICGSDTCTQFFDRERPGAAVMVLVGDVAEASGGGA